MQTNISRRQVTSGLAWSVPAVAAVAAAPAFAASPRCISATAGSVVKFPGGSSATGIKQGYGFPITVNNISQNNVHITPDFATVTGGKKEFRGGFELWDGDPCEGGQRLNGNSTRLDLAPGETRELYLVVRETGNSANTSGCITARIGVTHIGGTPVVGDLCSSFDVPTACFDEATPSSC